jgi:sugar transferase (PEP-CTERM system associated)
MSRRFKFGVVLFEAAILFTGYLFGMLVRLGSATLLDTEWFAIKALAMVLVTQAALFYNGLYDFRSVMPARTLFVRIIASTLLASVLLALLFYIVPGLFVGRGVALLAVLFNVLVFTAWRIALGRFMASRPLWRVLILGTGELAQELVSLLHAREGLGFRLVGCLANANAAAPGNNDGGSLGPEVIGTADQLSEICRRHDVDMVVVAMADRRGNMPMAELLDLKFAGVEVLDGVHLYEQFTEKLYIRELKPSAMVFSEGFRQSDMRKASKRVLDVVVASIGLVIAAIPMLVTALLVKLTSPGPSIYAQERVGEFGRVFTIYKFRSMRLDSERDGPKLASRDDPRVTAFGRFIRKTRLDELPQLFNVLRGDMSLVGPRPERPVFHIKLQREVPFFRQRLFVKPGVTGLAQVKFRYAETAEDMVEKLQYDLAYIKHMSLLYDLQIILETAKVMLFRRGAQ